MVGRIGMKTISKQGYAGASRRVEKIVLPYAPGEVTLNANPALIGVLGYKGAGCSGQLADGYQARFDNGGLLECVAYKEVDPFDVEWQCFRIFGTAGTESIFYFMPMSDLSELNPTDKFDLKFNLFVDIDHKGLKVVSPATVTDSSIRFNTFNIPEAGIHTVLSTEPGVVFEDYTRRIAMLVVAFEDLVEVSAVIKIAGFAAKRV